MFGSRMFARQDKRLDGAGNDDGDGIGGDHHQERAKSIWLMVDPATEHRGEQ